jgi:hypothetical protein
VLFVHDWHPVSERLPQTIRPPSHKCPSASRTAGRTAEFVATDMTVRAQRAPYGRLEIGLLGRMRLSGTLAESA